MVVCVCPGGQKNTNMCQLRTFPWLRLLEKLFIPYVLARTVSRSEVFESHDSSRNLTVPRAPVSSARPANPTRSTSPHQLRDPHLPRESHEPQETRGFQEPSSRPTRSRILRSPGWFARLAATWGRLRPDLGPTWARWPSWAQVGGMSGPSRARLRRDMSSRWPSRAQVEAKSGAKLASEHKSGPSWDQVSRDMGPTLAVLAPEFASNQEARFTIWTSAKMLCILAIVPTVSALFAPPGPNPFFILHRLLSGHRLIIVFHFVFFDGEHSPMMVPTSWYSGAAFSPTERYLEINM